MEIKKVSAGRGAAWVNESIGLLKSGGKSIWLPALLVGILSALPYLGAVLGLVMIAFYAGLVLCFDKPDAGHTAFSGFKDGRFMRLLPVIALNIGLAIIALMALWPIMQPLVEAAMAGTEPDQAEVLAMLTGLAKHMLWLVPVGIIVSWITQFAVPLVSLGERAGGDAVSTALSAVVANLPALLVNLICLVLVVIVACIVLVIPLALVGALFASSPMLTTLLSIPLTALLTAVMLVLMCGNMLYAYRDVFGQDATAVESANGEVLL